MTLPDPDRLTFGPRIERIAERLGGALFPWQRYFVTVATEQLEDGLGGLEPAYDTVGAAVTRRGGKTFMVKSTSVERGLRGRARIAFTAQTRDHARERWLEMADQVSTVSADKGLKQAMGGEVHVTSGNSNEMLTFRATGSQFFPFAPNAAAGHGGAYDLVFVDELWAHSLAVKQLIQQGYRPMWSVKPGQEWLLSAAGTKASGWLHDVRRRGRAAVLDPAARMAFIEFGIPDDIDVHSLTDEQLVKVTLEYHPRRGFGLRENYLMGELGELGRAGFLRAYANRDAEDDAGGILAPEIVQRQTAAERIPRGVQASVGVALDDARRETSVAIAWTNDAGHRIVESQTKPGVRWAAAYVAAMPGARNVAVVNTRNGRGFADELERIWAEAEDLVAVPVLRVSQADAVAAAGSWLASVEEDGTTFFAQSGHLTAALHSADLPVGGNWVSRDGEPITSLLAHTMAVWADEHAPAEATPSEFWVY
ncbi:MAG: hypothetical protein Q4F65_06995 [Propionibacteriaceae bacterium]|nr:hypothetical protein [Propionibacteriaceae bacterium]